MLTVAILSRVVLVVADVLLAAGFFIAGRKGAARRAAAPRR